MDPGQPPSTTEPGISHQNRKEDSNIAVELANTGPEPLDDLSDAAAITRDPDAEIENEVPQSTEALAGKSMPVASNEEDKNHMTAPAAPSDGAIKEELLKYLKEDTFTMDVTERQLRTRLEAHFGMPLKDKKTVIRDQIMAFIQTKQEMEEAKDEKAGLDGELEDGGEDDSAVEDEEDEEDQPVKKKRKSGGGLNASCRLSEPLQAFLGVETMSRPQVVKALWVYIKENQLQDPANKRKINVDDKLSTLFTKPLDMFSMNRQLSKHVKTNDGPMASDGAESNDDESEDGEGKPRPKRRSDKPAAEKPAKKAKATKLDGSAKKPSAFTRPLRVSPELSEWLGGQTEISRPELTKRFWAYAKENNLLDPNKKSMLHCDEALKRLTGEDSFLCFGFAKHIKKHLLGFADEPSK